MSQRFQALTGKLEPKYDYFRGTVEDDPLTVMDHLYEVLEMQGRTTCKGPPQYDHSVGFWVDRGNMETKAPDLVISYGGNNGADPGVLTRGGFADRLVPMLRRYWPHQARATRIDSCIDLWGCFDPIEAKMQEMHRDRRLKRNRYGVPETGQTFMLGSAKAPVQARLYEKGLQLRPSIHPAEWQFFALWTRLEVEYHPRAAEKDQAVHLSPLDVWGTARWAADLLQWVGDLDPVILVRRPTMERTPLERLEWLFRQHRRTILEVAPEDARRLLEAVLTGELGPLPQTNVRGSKGRSEAGTTIQ